MLRTNQIKCRGVLPRADDAPAEQKLLVGQGIRAAGNVIVVRFNPGNKVVGRGGRNGICTNVAGVCPLDRAAHTVCRRRCQSY